MKEFFNAPVIRWTIALCVAWITFAVGVRIGDFHPVSPKMIHERRDAGGNVVERAESYR